MSISSACGTSLGKRRLIRVSPRATRSHGSVVWLTLEAWVTTAAAVVEATASTVFRLDTAAEADTETEPETEAETETETYTEGNHNRRALWGVKVMTGEASADGADRGIIHRATQELGDLG